MSALILIATWAMFVRGLSWRRRLTLVVAIATTPLIALVVLHHLARREGSVNGAGVLRLVWRSAVRSELPPLQATAIKGKLVELVEARTNYPRFLGNDGANGVEGAHLSHDWTSTLPRELWRKPIGLGWGSFAVVNGFGITQEQRGPDEVTTCLDGRTGVVCWSHSNHTRFQESMGGDGPRATPTVADGRVYVMGATGILDCLDGATGAVLWSQNILTDTHSANLQWGKSCSPLVFDNLVIVSGGAAGPSLLAYDKLNGKTVWQAGTDSGSYASPVLAMLGDQRAVLSVNGHSVGAYNPQGGHVIFSYPWPGDWPKASQPVALEGGRVFISAGYGLGSTILLPGTVESPPTVLWHSLHLKTELSNVAVRLGFVYGLDDGVLTCLDLATGRKRWRSGRYGYGQILLVDDVLLIQAENGDLALVSATPDEYKELATAPALHGKTWNNPALSGHLLLVRNDHEAAAFELP